MNEEDEIREYLFYQEVQKLLDAGYPPPEAKLKVAKSLSNDEIEKYLVKQ